jgi:hypothetical protein
MMSLLKRIFSGGSLYERNPCYQKLKRLLKSQNNIRSYEKIYFLGGFEYNENAYQSFRRSLNDGRVEKFLESNKYNSQCDNIELYLIKSAQSYLLILLDPVELLSGERILEIVESPNVSISDFKYELIYE